MAPPHQANGAGSVLDLTSLTSLDRRDRVLDRSTSTPRPAARSISATSPASRAAESTPTPTAPTASSTSRSCPSSFGRRLRLGLRGRQRRLDPRRLPHHAQPRRHSARRRQVVDHHQPDHLDHFVEPLRLRRRRSRVPGPDAVFESQRRHGPVPTAPAACSTYEPDLPDRRNGLLHASASTPRPAARSISATSPASPAAASTPTPTAPIASSTSRSCPSSSRTPYYDSGFEAGNGGSILAGSLTTLNRGDIQLDDSKSSITTSQITSITSSNLTSTAAATSRSRP